MPKEVVANKQNISKPQSPTQLCNNHEAGDGLHNGIHSSDNTLLASNKDNLNKNAVEPSQPRVKLERTKSILKQSSKERGEHQEPHSPKKEQISFAPDEKYERLQNSEKRVSIEIAKKLEIENNVEDQDSIDKEKPRRRLRSPSPQRTKHRSNSESSNNEDEDDEDVEGQEENQNAIPKPHTDLNPTKELEESPIKQIEIKQNETNLYKAIAKPIEKIKQNCIDSKSESSSSKIGSTSETTKSNMDSKTTTVNNKQFTRTLIKDSDKPKESIITRRQCSPTTEITTNQPITFASAISVLDNR